MGQIKGLIDEFSKLTGELQTENTFDIHFWNVQISEFANIVIKTIRKMDHQFNLNSQLEYSFGIEFKKCWDEYRETQKKILDGELPINYGEKERNINTFNIIPDYDKEDETNNLIDEEELTDDPQYINSLNEPQIQLEDNTEINNNINYIKNNDLENNRDNNLDNDLENEFIQEQKLRGEYNNTYYNHYLTEEEDFKEQDKINTIKNNLTEEDKYNNQQIVNQLKESYKDIIINNDEQIQEPLVAINEIVDNRNKLNTYNTQELNNTNLKEIKQEQKESVKKMKNTISSLKNKFLKS